VYIPRGKLMKKGPNRTWARLWGRTLKFHLLKSGMKEKKGVRRAERSRRIRWDRGKAGTSKWRVKRWGTGGQKNYESDERKQGPQKG